MTKVKYFGTSPQIPKCRRNACSVIIEHSEPAVRLPSQRTGGLESSSNWKVCGSDATGLESVINPGETAKPAFSSEILRTAFLKQDGRSNAETMWKTNGFQPPSKSSEATVGAQTSVALFPAA